MRILHQMSMPAVGALCHVGTASPASPCPARCPARLRPAVEFLDAGLQTTVQDYPGRVALWSVGVPPSGPMDDLSHR